jgi:hypothetical protein
MYAAGADHPLKKPCLEIIDAAARPRAPFFTNAEVLQELIHRYRAINAWATRGRGAFGAFLAVMEDRIEPMLDRDVIHAAELLDATPRLSARDLVHVAVMERVGATAIVTADTTFDGLKGIERLDPLKAKRWLPRLTGTSD